MTDRPVVVLRNLKHISNTDCESLYPGAFVISSEIPDHFRGWTAREIYVEEGAAKPHVVAACRSRQVTFKSPVLEILPEWQIRTRFMSAHDAMALYSKHGVTS